MAAFGISSVDPSGSLTTELEIILSTDNCFYKYGKPDFVFM